MDSGYEPAGGWSGAHIQDAPPAAPVALPAEAAPADLAPDHDGPQLPQLIAALFVAYLVIAVVAAATIFYSFVGALVSKEAFGEAGSRIFLNVIWVLITIKLSQGVVQMISGWRPRLGPLAVAMALGTALAHSGLNWIVAASTGLAVQVFVLSFARDAFTPVHAERRRAA